MKVLLTGATGLLGERIGRRLAERGHEVLGVARHAPTSDHPTAFARIDCRDDRALAEALRGRDALVHNAGISLGPAVAKALRAAPVGRVVAVSSAAVTSRARASATLYRAGEEALRDAHPATLLVRPTMIYGSDRDRNVHHVIAFARRFHFLPLIGAGRAHVQPIHVDDLAAATADLLETEATGPVEAGGEAPLTLRGAAVAILAGLGLPPRVIRLPHRPVRIGAVLIEAAVRRRVVERIDRMLEERVVDNSRLRTLTGVRPRSFEDGVRDQVRGIRP